MTASWERVTKKRDNREFPIDRTERMRVPGGWLYRSIVDNDDHLGKAVQS